MDLNTVTRLTELRADAELPLWQPGDAWLAGGTWLFSEPQPKIRRLLDLTTLGWPALSWSSDQPDADLIIGATCTIAELYRFATKLSRDSPSSDGPGGAPALLHAQGRPGHRAERAFVPDHGRGLIRQCCEAFLASFKIWNVATVGGNLGNALPAGPMISLTAGLDGRCEIWAPGGGRRRVAVIDLILGNNRHGLNPGEAIRSITLPHSALRDRTAFRQQSLTTLGRSAALLIGRIGPNGFTLTVTAATVRPVRVHFPGHPDPAELSAAIDAAIPPHLYHDDVHGLPAWRRHLTFRLAEEIRQELA